MSNFFDQYDATPNAGNFFDQYDPAPDLPSDPATPALGDVIARAIPQATPLTVPEAPQSVQSMVVPQTDPIKMDKSTAGGDLAAGVIQLKQVLPGLNVAKEAQKIGVADRAMTANMRNAAELWQQADELEAELPNLPDDESRQQLAEGIAEIRNKAEQLEMTDALSGAVFKREQNQELINSAAGRAAGPAQRVAELQAEADKIPMNPAAAAILNPQGEGFIEKTGDVLSSLASDPGGATRSLFLRSAPQLVPVAAASVAGFLAAGPAGAATGGGLAGGGLEMGSDFSQSLLEILKQANIEPTNQQQVTEFLTLNPGILDEALTDAGARAVIIGGMDAVSGGLVGGLAKSVSQSGRAARVGAAASGGVIETATEGAGEAAAQAATEGEVNPGDVLAEMIGAGPVGAVTAGAQVAIEADKTPGRVLGRELGKMVEKAILDAAPAVPTQSSPVVSPRIAPNQPEPPQQDEVPDDDGSRGSIPGTSGDGVANADGGVGATSVLPVGDAEGSDSGQPTFNTRRVGSSERSIDPNTVENQTGPAPSNEQPADLNGEEPAQTEPASENVSLPQAPEAPQKKPLTNIVQRDIGKIDPSGPIGQELINQGVTPRTAPSLFRKGGISDLDNVVGSEHQDIANLVGLDDTNTYLSQNGLVDAIVDEFRGRPAAIGAQADVQARYAAYEQEIAQIEGGYENEPDIAYDLPEGVPSWRIPAPDQDISTGIERLDSIDAAIRGFEQQSGLTNTFTAQERSDMVDYLDRTGGPVEAAVERVIIGDISYAETGSEISNGAPDQVPGTDQRNPERSEDTTGAESARAESSEDGGRTRQGTKEDGRVDVTPEGEQTVIPGAEKITDKEQAERKQQEPKRGNDAPPPAGGLFDDDARNQGQLLDASARVGRRPPGRLSPSFTEFSYTTRASVFRHAFDEAGIDPDTASLMPLGEQLSIVSKAVEKRFGIKVELPTRKFVKRNLAGRKVKSEKTDLSERKALDQLLNAYRQLQMLAHVMSVPEKAIGLPIKGDGITLSLVSGSRLRGALGMFSWGASGRTIHLPDMSNSFAHEWGHALDHYLGAMSDKPLLKGLLSRDGNLSGAPLSPKRALTEAFAHVVWSMYGNSSQAGAIVLQAQVDSAQIGSDGKPTPKAKRAQKVLNDIRAGKKPPQEYLSDYFKASQAYDEQIGADGYFTDPAEMFARAFEAMVGTEVAKISDQPQAFLSKGEWAYSDKTDTRAALTFPKDVDLQQFTLAMVSLKQAMGRINLFGPDAPAKAPQTHDILSTRDLLKTPAQTRIGNLTSQERGEWGRTLELMGNLPQNARNIGGAVTSGVDAFYSQAIRTGAATMFAIADRQTNPKARQALENIAKVVGKRPGRGKLVTSLWEENVRRRSGANVNKIDGALRKALSGRKKSRLTQFDQEQLRQLLVGDEVTNPKPELKRLAADLRAILNDIWYDLQGAGIKVGYASQYLPHIYDADKATADPDNFRAKASEVYDLMFEREIVNNDDPDSQAADMKSIANGLMKATVALPTGERDPAPRLSSAQADTVNAYFTVLKDLNKHKKALAKVSRPSAVQRHTDAIAEIEASMDDLKSEALDVLRKEWADYSAENWLIRTRTGEMDDFGSIGPTANFMKERVLPNEAGLIMKEFMHDNPVEMITNYAFSAAKRAEYASIFGADNEKLQNMLDAAEGATKEDIDMMKEGVRASTGRIQSSGTGYQAFKTTTFSLGNMSLLSLAAMSSLAEPLTAGLRSGQARDSLNAIAQNFINLVRRGRKRELNELAKTIGLIMPYATDTLMQNRLGADVLNNQHWLQTNMSRFFILNGLTPLTHYQRSMMLPVANAVLLRHLRADVEGKRGIYGTWRDTIDGERGGHANGELNELGIPSDDREDLLKWLDSVGGMPSPEDMFGPDGQMHKAAELWARATYRFSTETIQDTLKSDRTYLANHPDHAAMYGIMSFIDAFTRNVIWRTLERGIKDDDGKIKGGVKMSANAATALLPMGILIGGQILSSIVREAIFNADKLEEKMEDEDFYEWLIMKGIDRSGVSGRLSPLLNLMTGIRYDTDMTSLFAGPYTAFFLNNIQNILGTFMGRNSANTNTTEHTAAKAIYQTMVKPPLVALITGAAPMGPVSVNGARAALGYLSMRTTEADFADGLVGEKGEKHVGDPPWWDFGG